MSHKRSATPRSRLMMLVALLYACQAEVLQDHRSSTSAPATKSVSNDEDAQAGDTPLPEPMTPGTIPPPANPPTAPVTNYSMSWDATTDPTVQSYKIFVVPPDRNPRFPGRTDIPIPVKTLPLSALQRNGPKYTAVVTGDDLRTALATVGGSPTAYCFTIVAVNTVGNSPHSPLICP